ncbi:hypothetical protein, partial [Streptomyces sp. NRRL S-104]
MKKPQDVAEARETVPRPHPWAGAPQRGGRRRDTWRWLTQVFLTLRRGVTEGAHALATELQPCTEKPGRRVPVRNPCVPARSQQPYGKGQQAVGPPRPPVAGAGRG